MTSKTLRPCTTKPMPQSIEPQRIRGCLNPKKEAKDGHEDQVHKDMAVKLFDSLHILNAFSSSAVIGVLLGMGLSPGLNSERSTSKTAANEFNVSRLPVWPVPSAECSERLSRLVPRGALGSSPAAISIYERSWCSPWVSDLIVNRLAAFVHVQNLTGARQP
jgi:hypothetical protein